MVLCGGVVVWWCGGVWCVVCGVWCVACGVWCVVCGVWCVVCGVWCVVVGDGNETMSAHEELPPVLLFTSD